MAFTATLKSGEQGSLRPLGAGFSMAVYDIVNTAGSVGGNIVTPFMQVESVMFCPTSAPVGLVIASGYWTSGASPTVALVTSADADGVVVIIGRGM